MYGYNYNIPNDRRFMYRPPRFGFRRRNIFSPSFTIPFLLGGIVGSSINQNNFYPYPNYYYPPVWYY